MQRVGAAVLIGVVALSLVSSGLIVWLYVGRNLIARLTALSDSMLAIAGGNLRTPLPPPAGATRSAAWPQALAVFRDTAVEIEEKNLRDLHALLETIDYGVVMLNPDLTRPPAQPGVPRAVGHGGREPDRPAAFSRRARTQPAPWHLRQHRGGLGGLRAGPARGDRAGVRASPRNGSGPTAGSSSTAACRSRTAGAC